MERTMDQYKIVENSFYDTPFLSNMGFSSSFAEMTRLPMDTRKPLMATAELISPLDAHEPKVAVAGLGLPKQRKFQGLVNKPKKPYASTAKKTGSLGSIDSGIVASGGLRRKARKNNREKARRSELNDKFDRLCQILNLGLKTKAEKFAILTEAINVIIGLKSENSELKSEKSELRSELAKLTSCLQHAFPNQPIPTGADSRFQLNPEQGIDVSMPSNLNLGSSGPLDTSQVTLDQHQFEPTSVMTAPVIGQPQMQNNPEPQGSNASGPTPFTMNTQSNAGSMQEDFDLFA